MNILPSAVLLSEMRIFCPFKNGLSAQVRRYLALNCVPHFKDESERNLVCTFEILETLHLINATATSPPETSQDGKSTSESN